MRDLTGDGVDIVLDAIGGAVSLRSFRALRSGGRLVVYGRHATIAHGTKNWPAVFEWYAAIAAVAVWGLLSPGREVSPIGSRSCACTTRIGSARTARCSSSSHPVTAERMPFNDARRAHELLESTAATGKLVLVPS